MNDARAAIANRPSNSTLAKLPARVLTFVIALATRAPIRALMYEGGYRVEDHTEGWRLLTAAGEIRERAPVGAARFRAQEALVELHAWVTANFRRFRAAMERLHPEWLGLLPEVDSRYSADALLAMARLVERVRRGDGRARHEPATNASFVRSKPLDLQPSQRPKASYRRDQRHRAATIGQVRLCSDYPMWQ